MKRIFGLIIVILSLVFVISCKSKEGEDQFVDYSITTKGVLTWNKIDKAKYYYVTTNSFSEDAGKWVKGNKIDLSSKIIETNAYISVSIYASSTKSTSGRLSSTNTLRLYILKQLGNYYLEKDATIYTVKFDTDGLVEVPEVTDFRLQLPRNIIEGKRANWYYDKERTQEVTESHIFITSDITLYAKFVNRTCKVTFYGDTAGTTIVKEITVDMYSFIEESDMPDYIPKEGYTFLFWRVHEDYSIPYEIEFPFKVIEYTKIYPIFKRN